MPEETAAPVAEPAAKIEKHPHIRALFNDLNRAAAEIEATSAPLRKQRDELLAEIEPVQAKIRALNAEIRAIERPRLPELKNQIGVLAGMLGGRRMSEGPRPGDPVDPPAHHQV